jgi:hypothetical protein
MPTLRSLVRQRLTHRPGDLTAKLDETRTRIVQLEAERDVLRSQVKDAKTSARSIVDELRRLRDVAFSDPGVQPSDAGRRYVIVMSSDGGSGPRLVQQALNRVPGVDIRGEIGGPLHDLFRLHRNSLYHQSRLLRANRFTPTTNAWWGIDGYPQDLALREIRRLVTDLLLRPDSGTHTLGFVETEWPEQQVADHLQFLRGVFPGARFILTSRRPEGADQPDCFDVGGEDIAGDPEALRSLFGWLQLEFPEPAASDVVARSVTD